MRQLLIRSLCLMAMLLGSLLFVNCSPKAFNTTLVKRSVTIAPDYYSTSIDDVFSIVVDYQNSKSQMLKDGYTEAKFVLVKDNIWTFLKDHRATLSESPDSKNPAVIKTLKLDRLTLYETTIH
jgi:hypothetical protein